MEYTPDEDLQILKQLYFANHLNENELERANKLLYLLNVTLKARIK